MNKLYLFLINIASVFYSYSQALENIDFFSEGRKVVITYDLINCEKDVSYDIKLLFIEQNTNQILTPKSISGDLLKITCGSKRIIWEVDKDLEKVSGKYYPNIVLTKRSTEPTDYEGYVYKTVKIGKQEWFAENLRTSYYNDGTLISHIRDEKEWSAIKTGAWCFYNDDDSYIFPYGKLYNWYSLSKKLNGNKNLCPAGWHVPSDNEWAILIDYLGGYRLAHGKLKASGTSNWVTPNTDATNSSGFSGLPGGFRNHDGKYHNNGVSGYWWTTTETSADGAMRRYLNYIPKGSDADRLNIKKKIGVSIRCVRD